jgi:hypothetical protein
MHRKPSRTSPGAGVPRTLVAAHHASALLVVASAALGCGGALDAQPRLRAAVDAKRADFDRCYDVALGRNRDAAGDMKVVVAFTPAGRVGAVTAFASKVDDKDLVACVTSVMREVRVDPPPPVDLKVEYTMVFRATEPRPAEPEPAAGGAP